MMRSFQVVKTNKRLWVKCVETDELVYTPPDFIRHRLQSREPMKALAARFTEFGGYDINAVAELETNGL